MSDTEPKLPKTLEELKAAICEVLAEMKFNLRPEIQPDRAERYMERSRALLAIEKLVQPTEDKS